MEGPPARQQRLLWNSCVCHRHFSRQPRGPSTLSSCPSHSRVLPPTTRLFHRLCRTVSTSHATDTLRSHALPASVLRSLQDWREHLLQLLNKWPQAIVGEIGIDRAARVPDTKHPTSYDHQWSLFKEQMAIAAQFNRPVRHQASTHSHGPSHAQCFLSVVVKRITAPCTHP